MAQFSVGIVSATLAVVVAVVAVSAGDSETRVGIVGDRDDGKPATGRRQVLPIIYHVDEHPPIGSFVGDLRTDVRSACDDRLQDDCDDLPTRFSLLHQRPAISGLFDLHETTGVLRISGVVDREKVCFRRETVCAVVLEVAIHYAAAGTFDVAVVEVCDLF